MQGLGNAPCPIGIDSDLSAWTQRIPDSLYARGVLDQRLAPLGNLDLGRAAAGCPSDRVRLLRSDRGNRAVNGDLCSQRRRPTALGRLVSRTQPRHQLGSGVIEERAPFPPARRPAPDHALTFSDAAKAGPQTERVTEELGWHAPQSGLSIAP